MREVLKMPDRLGIDSGPVGKRVALTIRWDAEMAETAYYVGMVEKATRRMIRLG